jgi:hypothetical protein
MLFETRHLSQLLPQPQLGIGHETFPPICGFCRFNNARLYWPNANGHARKKSLQPNP